MRQRSSLGLLPVLALVVGCADQEGELAISTVSSAIAWTCPTPPYSNPAHQPGDTHAFESILEASGYGSLTNSDWVDMAAGNLCGDAGKELVLLKNSHSFFSILRGPAPFAVGAGDLSSITAHPWRGVAAGDLDGDGVDEIVGVRHVTSSLLSEVVVARANASCDVVFAAETSIGGPANSEWLDVAVGNFDGVGGDEIAILKQEHASFVLLRMVSGSLGQYYASDLGTSASMPWKTIAAGDLDGDGKDELIASRLASAGGASKTVLVYRWNGSAMVEIASSTVGNAGNSSWIDSTTGDFDGNGRDSLVLMKGQHSNFLLFNKPTGSSTLSQASASDIATEVGQEWRGVAATDWLGGDPGAAGPTAELVAVRKPAGNHRTDLFVLGNASHRTLRDSGLAHTEAQYFRPKEPGALKATLKRSHSTTYNFLILESAPDSYVQFIEFLESTKNGSGYCVDDHQLRVWVTLIPPSEHTPGHCSIPANSPLTPFSDTQEFENGGGEVSCEDYVGWARLLGRVAQLYPHLVGVGIDDFTHNLDTFDEETIAQMESEMRSRAPWLNLVPTFYYKEDDAWVGVPRPDLVTTLDSILFYFRDDRRRLLGVNGCPAASCDVPAASSCNSCLASPRAGSTAPCAESSVAHAPTEVFAMAGLLPPGRKMQVGVYFQGHSACGTPTAKYDADLSALLLAQPSVDGLTVYTTRNPDRNCSTDPAAGCMDDWFSDPEIAQCNRNPPTDKRCVVEDLFSAY